jgi:hypothetical protein
MDLRLFKTRAVRDLAWSLIQKPPFVSIPGFDQSWLENDLIDDNIYLWLSELDNSPSPLEQHLQEQRSTRLGIYFEQLLSFYFTRHPRFQLLGKNIQVNDRLRTLGEFDFIVFDRLKNQVKQIEVAIKFYLGHIDTMADIIGNTPLFNWHQWVGPNRKDTLARKMIHLKEHQLMLSKSAEGKAALKPLYNNDDNIQVRLLLRGRFFFPLHKDIDKPKHCNWSTQQHHWTTLNDAVDDEMTLPFNSQYCVLPRKYWLSELTKEELNNNEIQLLNGSEMKQFLIQDKSESGKEWQLAELDIKNKTPKEVKRFFIIQ